jgi:hypothetical protein
VATLNAGYAANGKVMCQRGGKSVLMSVYNAMLHAGIGRTYPALADRSITITLQKSMPSEVWVSVLHEGFLHQTGREVNAWLAGKAERKFLASQPPMARLLGDRDPRHLLKLAPMAAVAELAGIGDVFREAEEEVTSGLTQNPLPSQSEMLIADLADHVGTLMSAADIRAALPGRYPAGRFGDTVISQLMREAGVGSDTSNSMRGYRIPSVATQHTAHSTQHTAHSTLAQTKNMAAVADSLGA